jgi:hypothetical protein
MNGDYLLMLLGFCAGIGWGTAVSIVIFELVCLRDQRRWRGRKEERQELGRIPYEKAI